MAPLVVTDLELPAATQVFAAGDWNRDGQGDLVTRQNEGDTLKLRLGTGPASSPHPPAQPRLGVVHRPRRGG